jgi:hypothetical protein
MADSARTPTPVVGTAVVNMPAQALTLLRQIRDAENAGGAPAGGVTITYTPTAITGTFTFPVERVPTPEGENVRVVNFLK